MDNVFNLIDEPWVPVVYCDGHPAEVSLRQLFVDAHLIKGVSGDIPQQQLPMLRLALAIMYRALRQPDMDDESMLDLWGEMWQAGAFDITEFDRYFETWHDRFFLLGDRPFFQVPGLAYVDKKPPSPVSEMIADVPKPDKYLFAMRGQQSCGSLSLPEAALCLVFLQSFDTAGIKTPVVGNSHINKGKVYAPKGAVGTGWLGALGGVYVETDNLFGTLMLNWCMVNDAYDPEEFRLFGNEKDVPVWEADEVPSPDMRFGDFEGPVQALTWQSRRVRLVPDDECKNIIGVVNCYGDVVTARDHDPFEKMTAWRESDAQRKKLGLSVPPRMPVTHNASKALWRGLEPLLTVGETGDHRPGVIRWIDRLRDEQMLEGKHPLLLVTIHAQGMTYGTQSSVYETGIDDSLSLSTMMFRKDYEGVNAVVDVVNCTDRAVKALAKYVRNLQVSAGDKGSKSQVASEQVEESAYAALDQLFRDRISAFTQDQQPLLYAAEWKDEVHRRLLSMGRDYLTQSSVPVFEEHEAQIIGVMSPARAQLMFQGALNKHLGPLHSVGDVAQTQGKGGR